MDLRITGKSVPHTFEGAISIFHKDSEAMSTWIFRASEEDHWSNIGKYFKKFNTGWDDKHESCKTDMVDGFVYRI